MSQHTVKDALAEEWKEISKKLATEIDVAGTFFGWKPEGYSEADPKIFYVGKATSGTFDKEKDHELAFNGSHAFWSFARRIVADAYKENLASLAWSNISKIGVPQISPDASLLKDEKFKELAIRTLCSEINDLNPKIIVFVTAHFGECILREVVGGQHDQAWDKSDSHDLWWMKRNEKGYAVLWMRHPQGAKSELLDYAASKISELVKA
jgi:hypothetical protein